MIVVQHLQILEDGNCVVEVVIEFFSERVEKYFGHRLFEDRDIKFRDLLQQINRKFKIVIAVKPIRMVKDSSWPKIVLC